MIDHRFHTALYFFLAASLTACGGGGSGGDADQNVVRTLFAVGDVVEMVEDGGSVEGDVSTNDRGGSFTYALASGASMANGELEFNEDGTFIYIPNADFFGTDSVDYVATDPVSGETDTATLTISVENDFEQIEEYGWQLVWSDDFNSGDLDAALWSGVNTSVSGGNLVVAAQ
ncbi:MAG: Ig-like domain-containing protein, partial [Porticoccaceae bacterium]